MNVIIQLCRVESPGVKSDQMNLVVRRNDRGEDGTEGIRSEERRVGKSV